MRQSGTFGTSVLAIVTGCVLVASVGLAQEAVTEEAIVFPWYVAPSLGYVHFEGDQELEPGVAMGVLLGYDANERWTLEAGVVLAPSLSANTGEWPAQDDASLIAVHFDGLFHFTRWDRVDPYLAAGIGFSTYSEDLEDGETQETVLRGGAGVMYHFNDVWSVRADFRGMLAGFGENPNANHVANAGVMWSWGASVPERPMVVEGPEDTDGDGLTDAEEDLYGTDKYHPDTDRDKLYDGPEVKRYKTDPLHPDTDEDMLQDGDEVLSYNTDPLREDTDKGGVIDGHEVMEDNTNPLDPADDLVLYTLNIEFDTDKWDIKPEYFPQIDIIAKVMARNPRSTAKIEGHADKRKRSVAAYNKRLSDRRAKAVLEYLVTSGNISSKRLASQGCGFERPLPGEVNDPATGNRRNRRVEIYISGVEDKTNLPTLPVVEDIKPEDK